MTDPGEVLLQVLREGCAALDLPIGAEAEARLVGYAERLLHWAGKVNLTSVTRPAEVAEVLLVDSLALLRTLERPVTLLDVGSGAGLPGIPLACARPGLRVTCCDTVHKKVSFVKLAAAELGLSVEARAVRAAGDPDAEGLPRCDAVVSRALADPARWIPLGARYRLPGGKLFVMLGREAEATRLERLGETVGLRLEVLDRFVLPRSGAARAVARLGPP